MDTTMTRSHLTYRWLSRCALIVSVISVAGTVGGCLQSDIPKSSLGGQVVISGGVRGARIWVDQLDGHGEVHRHVGEAITDETGRFQIETGLERGVFRISARGGAYRDLATGATIQLDESDEIVSLTGFEVLALRGDFLVSPISHMIAARTMERLRAGGDIRAVFAETRESFHRHFGDVSWGQVIPWPLDQPALSPTEPVRAAFVLAALSVLASDIAAEAQAGPQEVSVYRLMEQWTEDIRADPFDGNDDDDLAPGSGLQLGFCPPVPPSCVPGTECSTGHCRGGCDLYSGTARNLLAGAMIRVIQDAALNRTGLDLANTISLVRGVSDNADPALFAATCAETPALSFQPSTVRDEGIEAVTFAADHSPQHAHTGVPIDLASSIGCPMVTKFSHLLGSTGPEYVVEDPGRNPIQYQLVTDDAGVGIAPESTQYRVGRRSGPQTIWVLDWTSAGIGEPIGTGVTRFPVGIYSDVVPGLATTEGTYDVELRTTDRLGRTATAARCFNLRLRAPPLDFEVMGSQPTKVHAYALDSLSLAPLAQFDQVATRLLNNDATGASLLDQDIFNGTTSTVYLTVTVTRPDSVLAAQSFVVANAPTEVDTAPMCPVIGCEKASKVPEDSGGSSAPVTTLHFPVRVFELVGGVPAAELPCLAPCPLSGTEFRFAIPPRPSGGRPARAFRVMTMIGQVSGLWPRRAGQEAAPPFEDAAITWTDGIGATLTTRLTGIVDRSYVPSRTGCVKEVSMNVCDQAGTLVPYRALASASLTFTGNTVSRYATAATASLEPDFATQRVRASTLGWSTSEGTLPKDLLP